MPPAWFPAPTEDARFRKEVEQKRRNHLMQMWEKRVTSCCLNSLICLRDMAKQETNWLLRRSVFLSSASQATGNARSKKAGEKEPTSGVIALLTGPH